MLDIVLATFVLIVTSPLLLTAMLAVLLVLGRPVFHRQKRTGRSLRSFEIIKLRTMTVLKGHHGAVPLSDAQRLGRLGRLLRRFSIDELPQLFNVLRGDMSMVGPRPLLPKYDAWYSQRELLRFSVRPGITGLAQVNGRNETGWNERLELDVKYVTGWSWRLELAIILRTVAKVAVGAGVAVDTGAAMRDLDQERLALSQ